MADYKLDKDGDITGSIIDNEAEIAAQRVLHIIRSYQGDLPVSPAHGNPSSITDKFNPERYISTFKNSVNDLIESDPDVNGLLYLDIKYDNVTSITKIDIINTYTKSVVTSVDMDYDGRLFLPITNIISNEHSSISLKTDVNIDLNIIIPNCSFINSKLVFVNKDKPILTKMFFNFDMEEPISVSDIMKKLVKSSSYYIDSILSDSNLVFQITKDDILITTSDDTTSVSVEINYLERNITEEPTIDNFLQELKTPIIRNINKLSTKIQIPNMIYGDIYYIKSGVTNV